MGVKKGDRVKVEYEGKLDDGTVFDSSAKHDRPLEFEVGSRQVIKGFDDAVEGMEKGQEKDIKIKPEEAYGEHNEQLIKDVPKEQIPNNQEIKPGIMLGVTLPDGQQIPATVANVSEDKITLDLNHPLAGKNLNFKIKVVEVSH